MFENSQNEQLFIFNKSQSKFRKKYSVQELTTMQKGGDVMSRDLDFIIRIK